MRVVRLVKREEVIMTQKVPRGYRNKNPGNIDYNPANRWLGLDDPPSDGRFCRFREHRYGIRAMGVLLMTYYDRHGCDTVRKVLQRYAPPVENKTDRYVEFVARQMGVGPDERLNLHEPETMFRLVKAIIHYELGRQMYTDDEIWEGLEMAGFRRRRPQTVAEVVRTDTVKAATVTGGTVAAVSAALNELATATHGFTPLFGMLPLEYVLLLSVVILVLVVVMWWRSRRD